VANDRSHGAGIGLFQALMAADRLNGTIKVKNPYKPTVLAVVINTY
jgi:hypothetical protein